MAGVSSSAARNTWNGAPDLIVEIVSPNSQSRDRREKYLEYQSNGGREYWLIDPENQTVEMYSLSAAGKYSLIPERGGVIKSKVLRGLYIDLVWFGVLMTIVMEAGLIHPPVGLNIFVIKNIAPDIPLSDIVWGVLPFVLLMFVAVVLICIFPGIATGLPDLVMGAMPTKP